MWKKKHKIKKQNQSNQKTNALNKKKEEENLFTKIHENFVDQWIKKNVTSVSWWHMYVTYDITGK